MDTGVGIGVEVLMNDAHGDLVLEMCVEDG